MGRGLLIAEVGLEGLGSSENDPPDMEGAVLSGLRILVGIQHAEVEPVVSCG